MNTYIDHAKLSIYLGKKAAEATGLNRNDCVDSFVWLLLGPDGKRYSNDPAPHGSTLHKVANWVLGNEEMKAIVSEWNKKADPSADPMSTVILYAS